MERPSDWRVERGDGLARCRPLAPGKRGHLPDKREAGLRRRPPSDAKLRGQGRQESLQDRGRRRRRSPAGRAWRRRRIGGFAVAGGLQTSHSGSSGQSLGRGTACGIRRNRRRRTVLTAAPREPLEAAEKVAGQIGRLTLRGRDSLIRRAGRDSRLARSGHWSDFFGSLLGSHSVARLNHSCYLGMGRRESAGSGLLTGPSRGVSTSLLA